jgi:hypothetical protein
MSSALFGLNRMESFMPIIQILLKRIFRTGPTFFLAAYKCTSLEYINLKMGEITGARIMLMYYMFFSISIISGTGATIRTAVVVAR